MTDHFFPERDLGKYYFRPAEHINTGFVFGRPGGAAVPFLEAFITAHYEPTRAGVIRDGMDQRVFNKFYLAAMRCGSVGLYREAEWTAEPPPGAAGAPPCRAFAGLAPVSLRVMDPIAVSHGMNYFWRKASQLPGAAAPVAVHVNGVDPKLYF